MMPNSRATTGHSRPDHDSSLINHNDLGRTRYAQLRALAGLRRNGDITLGGHRPHQIYGRLNCRAGKRMKPENRVFFRDAQEAIASGYRPCAVCLPVAYKAWRESLS